MLYQLIQFYLAIFLVLFLPGYFLLQLIFNKKYPSLLSLEKLLLSFILSLAVTDFLMLSMNYLHIALNKQNLLLSLLGASAFFKLLVLFLRNKTKNKKSSTLLKRSSLFSLPQLFTFIILLSSSIILRGIYIAEGIIPKSTDLGHHMYWAKYISTTGTLPTYNAKFIIGEHLPFSALNLLSGISFISSFPTIILFLFNIFTLLVVFLLIYQLAKILLPLIKQSGLDLFNKVTPINVALWGLFTVGILYPISAPQAKFVSGGVIGNIIGNLLLVSIIYSFLKTIVHKSIRWAGVFLIFLLIIIYTHHLSTFVLAYSLLAVILSFALLTLIFLKFNFKKLFLNIWQYLKLFLHPFPLGIMLLGLLFILKIHTPSYLNPSAIDTAVGTPTKITRVGISLPGIVNRIGAWRVLFAGIFALGFLPIFFNLLKNIFTTNSSKNSKTKKLISLAVTITMLFAWVKIIFLMSWKPGLLKIDIPTSRIITYLIYPITVMASFGIALFFSAFKNTFQKYFALFLFIFFISTAMISGVAQDIALNLRPDTHKPQDIFQTYFASQYLSEQTNSQDMVLKDHKYLAGDTWMKLFFMRDYKYPLSRTYNRRYEDKYNKHETCTRDMIAIPNSGIGQECFNKTHTKYIVLKKGYDDAVFKKSPNFQQVYSSKTVTIFQRK